MSKFWKELSRLSDTTLCHNNAYHPQTDGQTKLTNITWAEYSYNTAIHTTIGTTPFQIIYDRQPPPLIPYNLQTIIVEAVNNILQTRDKVLAILKRTLQQTQNKMKQMADKKRKDVSNVGDMVLLKFQPYR